MTAAPPSIVELALDGRGFCPVRDFVLSQNPREAAKLVRKMEHLAKFRRQDLGRPMVDTISGPIKELRVDKQLRVLFSCEQDRGVMLMLAATRKKNGGIDSRLIQAAVQDREEWLRRGRSMSLSELKKELGDSQRRPL